MRQRKHRPLVQGQRASKWCHRDWRSDHLASRIYILNFYVTHMGNLKEKKKFCFWLSSSGFVPNCWYSLLAVVGLFWWKSWRSCATEILAQTSKIKQLPISRHQLLTFKINAGNLLKTKPKSLLQKKKPTRIFRKTVMVLVLKV